MSHTAKMFVSEGGELDPWSEREHIEADGGTGGPCGPKYSGK